MTDHAGSGTTPSEQEEIEAMRRLADGDDLALNGIMERWRDRVTAHLFRMTGSQSVALDLAQETFVRLYQTRGKFRPRDTARPFSTWLFGITANLGRNHLRWKGRHPTTPLEAAEEASAEGRPDSDAVSHEREAAVRAAIATLPGDLREALLLNEYEDLPQAAIAVISGCSVKAVERRLSRARELLRKELSRYLRG